MFTVNGWEAGFLWVFFKEHSIVDIRYKTPGKFEVSTKHYPDYAPDFMKDNSFDQKQYCICLLRTTLKLSIDDMMHFLEHQCSLIKNPLEWLCKFDELLDIADDFKPIKTNKIRFKRLRKIINELCEKIMTEEITNEIVSRSPDSTNTKALKEKFEIAGLVEILEANPGYKQQISILRNLRASYIKEQKNLKKKDPFVKLVDLIMEPLKEAAKFSKSKKKMKKFNGTRKQLVRFYSDMRKLTNKDGEFVTDLKVSDEARWISDNYCKEDGKIYSESTIRKYLTDNNRTDFYNEKYK